MYTSAKDYEAVRDLWRRSQRRRRMWTGLEVAAVVVVTALLYVI